MRISSLMFHRDFKKDFSKLQKKTQSEFHYRIKLFLEDQFHPILNNHPLHGTWETYSSINMTGDIRAIYTTKNLTAIFVAIDTHSNLYK